MKRVFQKTLVVFYIPLCVCDFLLDRLRVIRLEPPLWAVFWTLAGAEHVALPMWRISSDAVQPSRGCQNDMDMTLSIALHGSILDPMSRLCEAAARPAYYQGDLLGL